MEEKTDTNAQGPSSDLQRDNGNSGRASNPAGPSSQPANHAAVSPISPAHSRSRAPVFIIGCPRSGTTMLYDYLVRSGGFAKYKAESNVFSVLGPAFGNIRHARNRRKLIDRWLRSSLFKVSGLDADHIRTRMMSDCRNEGDFLRVLMEQMVRQQGVERWAEKTPDHALYIREIDRQIPGGLFIHIIRDGRDVALSYSNLGWSRPLPWDKQSPVLAAGMYWKWLVNRARRDSRVLGDRYLEIRFEDLVAKPRETLSEVAAFIGQKLDYDEILKAEVSRTRRPNSSFSNEVAAGEFNPVGRWKKILKGPELDEFEDSLGDYLLELGYPLSDPSKVRRPSIRARLNVSAYDLLCSTKHWLKSNTPLGRRVDLARIESA